MALNYPINPDWSTKEIVTVIDFFNIVEEAYEKGVSREEFMRTYKAFKKIVNAKSEEKQLDQFYFEETGCSSYRAVQQAIKQDEPILRMKK
ncbi:MULTISPECIES: UPF0223 family protein [Exiguobacterium]|uniref:Uncharacterized protein n=1 Tax=Exiguobacterium oxidotolerans TaxID=223958 RepID=A0A653IDK8_9BACL|nr:MULTISPECIES: UPF0223 family protein [Exiguobacterium]ASI35866.1 hypothetical protein A0126_09885 [Exiguobacterium sp. N4-1P]VWX36763.1 conserved hypothetical protein [Exiguobacterium oxidotolerans]